jgi:hypothetical protein
LGAWGAGVATVVFVTEVEDEGDPEEVVAERDSIRNGWDSRETRRLLNIMSLRTQNRNRLSEALNLYGRKGKYGIFEIFLAMTWVASISLDSGLEVV